MLRELELKLSVCVLTVLNFTLKMAILLKPWCPPNDDRVFLPTEYNRKTSGRENNKRVCIYTYIAHKIRGGLRLRSIVLSFYRTTRNYAFYDSLLRLFSVIVSFVLTRIINKTKN
jgi:hypothetical protein